MSRFVCFLVCLGALSGIVGCGEDNSSSSGGDGGNNEDMLPDLMDDLDDDNNDDEPPEPEEVCQEAEVRERPCGADGTQRQVCVDNAWVNSGACQQDAECEFGQTQVVPCGDNDEGIQTQLCLNRQWTDEGPCVVREACEQDGQVRETRCGTNDVGLLIEECQGGFWTAPRACEASFVTLAPGRADTCGMTQDGTVYCWGERYGLVPVEVEQFNGALDFGAGASFSCVVLPAGEVVCWGSNSRGQLGDGTTEDRQEPVLVDGLSGVTSIELGGRHACAIVGSGEVWCWGSNDKGELGFDREERDSPIARPIPGVDDAVGLALGSSHTCILHSDRTVSCLGDNDDDQFGVGSPNSSSELIAMPGVDDAVQIAGLHGATCVLRESGSVFCVGVDKFQAPQLEGVTKLVSGRATFCALLDNQEVWCWGSNSLYALGDGSAHTPAPGQGVKVADLDDATDIFAGRNHTCALRSGGRASCWGFNDDGQLGTGLSRNLSTSPVQVFGVEDAVDLAMGLRHTCVLEGNGQVGCWGDNEYGQLGFEGRNNLAQRTEIVDLPEVSEVDGGAYYACARLSDGRVACWGHNRHGQLGNVPEDEDDVSFVPRFVDGIDDAVSLSMGESHACVMRTDNTVWCWGFGPHGQLGGGVEVENGGVFQVIGLNDAVQIAAGTRHTCALKADGTVVCWGAGSLLGVDSPDVAEPIAVDGLGDVVLLKAKRHHTCAIQGAGSVVCWGEFYPAPRGQGQDNEDIEPLRVSGVGGAVDLALGMSHTCAALENGAVICWGLNTDGNLGLPLEVEVRSPPQEPVPGLEGIVSVEAGWYHTCGISAEGQVWCWGSNIANRLGGEIKRSYVLAP